MVSPESRPECEDAIISPRRSWVLHGGGLTLPRLKSVCHAEGMREPEIIETELVEISAIADDSIKLERIIAWCALHPDEVPFALHALLRRRERPPAQRQGTGSAA